jgi:ParB-like chromosome segregation protein Spo0J
MNDTHTMLPFHPLAERYPLLEGKQFEDFVEDIRAHGQDQSIKLWQGQILDGRNRYRACLQLGIEPVFEDVSHLPEEHLDAYLATLNEHRRQLTPEWQKKLRDERIARVAQAHRQGASTREIAKRENVSQPQVVADIQLAGDKGLSPEPKSGKVVGKDGKAQAAKKPGRPRKEKEQPSTPPSEATPQQMPKKRRRVHDEQQPILDALGNAVPDSQKDVFADPHLPESIERVQDMLPALAHASIVNGLKARAKFYPYLRLADFVEHMTNAEKSVQLALHVLESGQPHVVCSCKGHGCNVCRKGGHLPAWRYEELQQEEQV